MIWALAALWSASENPGLPLSEALPLATAHYGAALTAEGSCAEDVAAWRLEGMPLEEFKRRLAWASRAEWDGGVLKRSAGQSEQWAREETGALASRMQALLKEAKPWAGEWDGHNFALTPNTPKATPPDAPWVSEISPEPQAILELEAVSEYLDWEAVFRLRPGESREWTTEPGSAQQLPSAARKKARVSAGEVRALEKHREFHEQMLDQLSPEALKALPPDQAEPYRLIRLIVQEWMARREGSDRGKPLETRVRAERTQGGWTISVSHFVKSFDQEPTWLDEWLEVNPVPAASPPLSLPGLNPSPVDAISVNDEPLAQVGAAMLQAQPGPWVGVLPDESILALPRPGDPPAGDIPGLERSELGFRPARPTVWLEQRVSRPALARLQEATSGGLVQDWQAWSEFLAAQPAAGLASPMIDRVMRRVVQAPLFPDNPVMKPSSFGEMTSLANSIVDRTFELKLWSRLTPAMKQKLESGEALGPQAIQPIKTWLRAALVTQASDFAMSRITRSPNNGNEWAEWGSDLGDIALPTPADEFWMVPIETFDARFGIFAWLEDGAVVGPYRADPSFYNALRNHPRHPGLQSGLARVKGWSIAEDTGFRVAIVWKWNGRSDDYNPALRVNLDYQKPAKQSPRPWSEIAPAGSHMRRWQNDYLEKLSLPPSAS